MPDPGARGLVRPSVVLAFGLLLAFAHAPELRSALLATDYAWLLGSPRGTGGPGARWGDASAAVWGVPAAGERALGFRLEHLGALLVLAGAAAKLLRRLLAPWLGPRPARSAAIALAVLLPLHPGALSGVAELAARGELAGVVLGAAAAAFFLAGRQDEHDGLAAGGLALLALAGWASPVAYALVPLLGVAELLSARRHRPLRTRLRTTATTCALALVVAAVPRLLAHAALQPDGGTARERVLAAFAELGRLALPSGGTGGVLALVGAGALLFAAWQPALRAARNAPRLWSALFLGWSGVLAVALAHASAGGGGRGLYALAVWTAGVATALTARSKGAVRVGVVAAGWALLAHAGARALPRAASLQARLAREAAVLAPASAGSVLVLAEPRQNGLVLARDFGWLLHPRIAVAPERRPGADDGAAEGFDPGRVRLLAAEAFPYLAMGEGFAERRARELAVVVPARALGAAEEGWRCVTVPPARPLALAEDAWRASLGYTPPEPLDPLQVELVRVVAELSIPSDQLARLAWSVRTVPDPADGWAEGHVSERGGRRVAEFDLARSLPWLLAGNVRSLVLDKGVRQPERGELVARLGGLEPAGAPVADGDDWLFASPGERAGDPGGRLVLALLASADLAWVELPLEHEVGGLRARGAERFARDSQAVEWTLEYRAGPHALARARGTVRRAP